MIDTHAHLDFENFDEDRKEVIRRAFDNGVKAIVNVGVDLGTSKKSIALAEKYENIFAAVGMHPDFFSKAEKEFSIFNFQFSNNSKITKFLNELKKIAKRKKVVAIGEIGLDYFRIGENNLTPALSLSRRGSSDSEKIKTIQKKGFLAQIELARELNLPAVVHCREAWEDLYQIISKFSQSSAFPFREPSSRISSKPSFSKFVLHCYSGEKKDTEKFLKLSSVYFSFSGNITYPPRKSPSSSPFSKGGEVEDVIRMIPLDRIMLDSDSPYLAPQATRGKRNEPANVRYIAEKIAEIKGISGEEVERITDLNAIKFFGI